MTTKKRKPAAGNVIRKPVIRYVVRVSEWLGKEGAYEPSRVRESEHDSWEDAAADAAALWSPWVVFIEIVARSEPSRYTRAPDDGKPPWWDSEFPAKTYREAPRAMQYCVERGVSMIVEEDRPATLEFQVRKLKTKAG